MPRSRIDGVIRSCTTCATLPVAASALAATTLAVADEAPATGRLEEIIVTAQRREETLQSVPISLQAIGTERLDELLVKQFADYVKYLPSVSYTTAGPGFSLPYFRGVASGENNNHSGPSPSVGLYLDDQPITTIQGALDIHMYDIARVEALAGPQGTLYGASSEAGTIRVITNKPDPRAFDAAYALEGNTVTKGGTGYVAEGFVNVPVSSVAAVRLVGWARHDAGYIDNVAGTRTYATSGGCISNSRHPPPGCASTPQHTAADFNYADTYGARAALRVDLDEHWTLTPTVMGQRQQTNGPYAYEPAVGDLKGNVFYPFTGEDKWVQAALTLEGRLSLFDVVYAGAFLKRDDFYNTDYTDYTFFYDQLYGAGAYWVDNDGNPLLNPSQYVHSTDGYRRQTHELRVTSPGDRRFRFVAGLFYQDSRHEIFSRYQMTGLADYLIVPGWPDTIWLTNQLREDKDQALFGEATFDLTRRWTASAGLRWFKTENSLRGFFGYNANYSTQYGTAHCFSDAQYNGSPCTNLDAGADTSGVVPKLNMTYHYDDHRLVYATYSEGFRPGGVNRNDGSSYKPDYLANYELGWKTSWLGNNVRLNGAVFREEWRDIQYSYIPPSGNGLTVIRNAGRARIDGVEVDAMWAVSDAFTLTGGASLLHARLTKDYVPDPDAPPQAYAGDPLPVSPKFKANVTGRYTFPVGLFDAHVQAALVHVGSREQALTRSSREEFGKLPAYTLTDFSAGVDRGIYSVELYVTNAFDEARHTETGQACDVCERRYYFPNQPRTVGLKFSQEF